MKKKLRKIMLIIIIIGICLTMPFPIIKNVKAVAKTIQLGAAENLPAYVGQTFFTTKKTTSGVYLYCVDIHKDTAQNATATLVGERDAGLAAIIRNGYPNKSFTNDKWKDYYITQTAVWWYLDNTTGSSNLGQGFKTNAADPYNLRPYIKKLVAIGEQARKEGYPTTELDISVNDPSMTLTDGYYVSNKIKATKISNLSSYQVSLENAPAGSKIVTDSNKETTTINANESFVIKVPASKVTDNNLKITVVATGTASVYKVYEYAPGNNMQNVIPCVPEEQKVTKTDKLSLELTTSKVSIVKIDNKTNKPLAGAKLVLKDSTGKTLATWTSTVNAHVVRNLPAGTYTVEEIEAPKGYKLNKKAVSFTVQSNSKEVKVTFANEAKEVVVNIVKIDSSTKEALAGAVLVVKDNKGNVIVRFTTTTEPYVLTDLEDGTYTVEEESAPAGYKTSYDKVSFTIDDDHLSHQIEIENYKEVPVPDTASSSILFTLLGIGIIGVGIRYIRKYGKI